MTDYRTEPCKSCGAPVIWAQTVAGKAMPVDAEPSEVAGNIALAPYAGIDPKAAPLRPLAKVIPWSARCQFTDLRASHFVTCPQAGSWRKRKATS